MNNTYLYWGSTLLIALFAALTGVLYFVAQAPAETIARLGYPAYVRILLGIGKLAGTVGLLVPLPRSLKEWVYAGFTIDFSMAIISHAVVGDPLSVIVRPVVALAVLWTSYAAYHAYVLADEDPANVSA
ncbi:MAG: DoxX family protein [Salinibacter sp.]